jgi:putative membrane protein
MGDPYPPASISVVEKVAKRWIWIFSAVVLSLILVLSRVQVAAPQGLDVHVFALANAVINSLVSMLLLVGLFTAKAGNWSLHRKAMTSALVLSVLFLISYILHHLFAGDTHFGGTGAIKAFYYFILATHIPLAGLSLPFILLTAYRGLRADHPAHRKMARRVWPVWFYVSVTGVIVYLMISPYY